MIIAATGISRQTAAADNGIFARRLKEWRVILRFTRSTPGCGSGSLANTLGRPATLADIPDAFLDQVAAQGFDYVWFLGLWQTGQAGREVSLSHPEWLKEFQATLPDFTEADISGSPFAVTGYTLHRDFGREADLFSLKERLRARGLKLLVDFVPNHTAPIIPG